MGIRNSYIITKALNSNLRGSVIIAISSHLVTTTDALVVSWLIGSKALTAVNIVIPVLTFFSVIMIMLSTGAAISISKFVGHREKDNVNLSFSASVVGALVFGVVAAILNYKFAAEIIHYLAHGDPALLHYATSYLQNYCYAVPFWIVAGVIGNIVRTDGHTSLVSLAVWIGMVTNVVLDILFIKFLNTGIAGAAWATGINYLLALLVCLCHFFSRNNTIGWSMDFRHYFLRIIKNCKLGFSTSLNTLLAGITLFIINNLMLHYIGNEGIYCWAVCYQIFLILQMLLSGVDTSIFTLGGMVLGEDDVKGLDYLYRRSAVYLITGVVWLVLAIVFFPEFFGHLFGNKGDDRLDLLPSVLKIFSLFLFPYAMVMQVRAIYTILERGTLSLLLCVMEFVLIIVCVYLAVILHIQEFWWSFPVASWALFVFLLFYTLGVHLKNKNLRMYSLIPKSIPGPIYNVSIGLSAQDVEKTAEGVSSFLESHKVDDNEARYVEEITSKIMNRILNELLSEHKKKRYFDLNLRIRDNKIIVILKDDGKRLDEKEESEILNRLNPKAPGIDSHSLSASETASYDSTSLSETDSSSLPLRTSEIKIVTNYFFMNDQNTFTINFTKPGVTINK